MVTKLQGKRLLKLARDSIISWLDKKELNFDKDKKKFYQKLGVFVTLKKEGDLRGCIGYPYPVLPLSEAVFQAARSAAFQDPRFEPLEKEELKKIKIEISVLTVPKEIKVKDEKLLDEIVIGKDGLIIQMQGYSGLLLPQVAPEYKWSALEFLEACCQKACLPNHAWQDKACRVFKFQAQIFSE